MKYNFDRKTKVMIILLSMFVGAVFGYIYEVIFYKIDTGHFINRGTTFGPWIPIYAYGTLLNHISGTRLWDYNTEILNFGNINGFICLRSVLLFGISGLLLMYIVIPLIERLSTKISTKKFNTISISLFSIFFIDTIYNHIISKVINYLK